MPSILDGPNADWFENIDSSSSLEFSQFFSKKKIKGKTTWRVKQDALSQVDVLYFSLPKASIAIDMVAKLTINKGIKILKGTGSKGEISEDDLNLVDEFCKTLDNEDSLSFLHECVRIKKTKGNLLLYLATKDEKKNKKNRKYQWIQIEPEKFSVITNNDNDKMAKYSLEGFNYHKKGNEIESLEPAYTLLIRSSPKSILGVPPFLFNNLYSKAIIAEIKKYLQIQNNGIFKKTLLSAAAISKYNQDGTAILRPLTNSELVDLKKDISIAQTDPNKSIQTINVQATLTELPTIDADDKFQEKYDSSFTGHVASLTGVAQYKLKNPESINRSTAEQEYAEMIEDNIQPENNFWTLIINKMFQIWYRTAYFDVSEIQLTIDNPKPRLDINYTLSELVNMENNKQITTNELRRKAGFEDFNKEDLDAREAVREKQLTLKNAKLNNNSNDSVS